MISPASRPASPQPEGFAGAVLWAPSAQFRRLPHLENFFPEARRILYGPAPRAKVDAILGRGGLERALARRLGLPYGVVDDGFICSVAGAHAAAASVSLIVDLQRRHDDPEGFFGLAQRLEVEAVSEVDLAEARSLIAFKRAEGLSRHNGGRPIAAGMLDPAPHGRVLVIDQPADDLTLVAPCKGRAIFVAMLQAAREAHPRARIVVLRSGCGRPARRGWSLPDGALRPGETLIEADLDVMALIEASDAVYVVSSLIGLDAVLAGRAVVCFGQPFFAGWGLTNDQGPTPARRDRRLSPEALFAGAYLRYARYVDPLSGEPCSPRLAFERLAAFKRHAQRVAGRWVGLNIPPPKHPVLSAFLAGPHSHYSPSPRRSREHGPQVRYAAWASKPNEAVRAVRREHPSQLVQIEDGFLRSVGLGSNFHPASSLVLDGGGIYYDPAGESDLERLLNHTRFDEGALAKAARLREAVVTLGLSKYNLDPPTTVSLEPAGVRRKLLVPGQVEDDASVKTGGFGWTNLQLLRAVREANPDAFILFKEHPDVTAGNRVGRVPDADARRLADRVVQDLDILGCIAAVDEVHTLTSLTGFEALLRGKPVTTYGLPFYGGWGLTTDRAAYPRPRRSLSLDALVAGVLVLYPLYLDPISRLPCDAETFVQRLQQLKRSPAPAAPKGVAGQLLRGWRATMQVIAPQKPPLY